MKKALHQLRNQHSASFIGISSETEALVGKSCSLMPWSLLLRPKQGSYVDGAVLGF
jgi:hypothetical protein